MKTNYYKLLVSNAILKIWDKSILFSICNKNYINHTVFFALKKHNFHIRSGILKTENSSKSSSYLLAMKYIRNNELIDAFKLNDLLSFANLSINQDLLDKILNKPVTTFINLKKDTMLSHDFLQNIGSIRNEKCLAGIYFWTHTSTGSMYVGSSRHLARRLIGYFKATHSNVGKFIPLLKKEGVNAFTLQVIPLNAEYYEFLELIIEQYFLLQPRFNLNTLKVVNKISGARSKSLYMYNKDFSKLIYSSSNQEEFIFKLKIHHSIITDSMNTGSLYLNKYVFTNQPVFSAVSTNLSLDNVLTLLEKERLNYKKPRKVVIFSVDHENQKLYFNSIKNCLCFLNNISVSNKTALYRHINTGKPYNGYVCMWGSEKHDNKNKSIQVSVTNLDTGESNVYSSIRKTALSFSPGIYTTGQTIKHYAQSGNIFKDKFIIKITGKN